MKGPELLQRVFAGFCLALAFAAPVSAQGPVAQVSPGTVVRWTGEGVDSCAMGKARFAPLGDACYYPIDLLRGKGVVNLARIRDGRPESLAVRVGAYPYPVQKLTLPESQVDLSAEDLARVRRESADIGRLWGTSRPRQFTLPLHPPLDPLPDGGRFGSRRVINGQPKSPHSGADYSAGAGESVLAAAGGTVALTAHHFFAGKSVFLDHGDGLISMYFHLSRIAVEEGQIVSRGQVVGAVGATGRATGPHLHFGIRWRRAKVDPAQLLGDPAGLPEIR